MKRCVEEASPEAEEEEAKNGTCAPPAEEEDVDDAGAPESSLCGLTKEDDDESKEALNEAVAEDEDTGGLGRDGGAFVAAVS